MKRFKLDDDPDRRDPRAEALQAREARDQRDPRGARGEGDRGQADPDDPQERRQAAGTSCKDELERSRRASSARRAGRRPAARARRSSSTPTRSSSTRTRNVVVTRDGWIKRVRELKDPNQTRTREGDAVTHVLPGSTKEKVIFFTNRGSAYVIKINDIAATAGYGDPAQKYFKFGDGETIVAAMTLDPRAMVPPTLLAVTRQGFGLRFATAQHTEVTTKAGRRYAKPKEGDEVLGVVAVQRRRRRRDRDARWPRAALQGRRDREARGPGPRRHGDQDRRRRHGDRLHRRRQGRHPAPRDREGRQEVRAEGRSEAGSGARRQGPPGRQEGARSWWCRSR